MDARACAAPVLVAALLTGCSAGVERAASTGGQVAGTSGREAVSAGEQVVLRVMRVA